MSISCCLSSLGFAQRHCVALGRGLREELRAHALALRVGGDADRDDQRGSVEERLDPEFAAELLDAGNSDREQDHADESSPYVETPGLDRRRSEKDADER